MTALAPSASACCSMRSKASLRVCSQSSMTSEMLPPTMVCKLAPRVPTMERERTTIPRTTPRLRFTRKPGSSNAVVTNSCGTMSSPFCRTPCVGRTPLAPIDLDHRRVFNDDGLFQRIHNAEARGAIDGGLRGGASHGNYPRLVQEEFGADHG